jgi:hypothetical protein
MKSLSVYMVSWSIVKQKFSSCDMKITVTREIFNENKSCIYRKNLNILYLSVHWLFMIYVFSLIIEMPKLICPDQRDEAFIYCSVLCMSIVILLWVLWYFEVILTALIFLRDTVILHISDVQVWWEITE